MPKLDQEIQRLIELSGKATQGEWIVEENDGYITGHIVSDKHTYAGNTASRTDSIFNENSMTTTDAAFTVDLVNFFRGHAQALLEAQRDAGRLEMARDTLGRIADYSDHTGAVRAFANVKDMALATCRVLDAAIDSKLRGGES